MFGPKFKAWADKNANVLDGLGALGVGLSQWDAGQPVNIIGAWDSIQNRRAQRKFGEAMRDPNLMAGFTPEQQTMLAQMPAEMAQSLIMEKLFAPPAPPPDPWAGTKEIGGVLYGPDMKPLITPEAKPGPAPMSPEDRDFWGIPKDDTRAYVLGKDGIPEPVGDLPKGADAPSLPQGYMWTDPQDPTKGMTLIPGYTPKDSGPAATMTLPDGTEVAIGGPGGLGGKLTEGQSKDVAFYGRMTGVSEELDSAEKALTGVGDNAATGMLPGGVANMVVSDEYRDANVKAKEWIAGLLRKDTGAAVTPQEFEYYSSIYMPRAGDDDKTIASKREARKRAEQGIRDGLGTAEIIGQIIDQRNAGKGDKPDAGATDGLTDDDLKYLGLD